MKMLFETASLASLNLPNRIVRSATYEGMARQDGTCTAALTEKMAGLAEGGVGLIITSHACVAPEGKARPFQLGVLADETVPGLAEMTRAVHAKGAGIVLQLAHGGGHADVKTTGLPALAPSVFVRAADGIPTAAMTAEDIARTVAAFAAAALRAKAAGFDGVQVHAAHGYLLSQFLSPHFNKRSDRCGGGTGNRARFLLEVVGAVRAAAGKDFAVLVKINSEDFLDDGFTVEMMLETCRRLEASGVDAVELSGGTPISGAMIPSRKGTSKDEEAYYAAAARRYKAAVKIPLILVGGIRSPEAAEKLLAEGAADFIALSRPLIREPGLAARWKSGDRRKAACVSCNLCYGPILAGKGMYCEAEARQSSRPRP